METTSIASKPIVKDIITITTDFGLVCDNRQLSSSIHPIIANAMFTRDKQLLEEERWETVRVLAKTLVEVSFNDSIKALGFKITK